MVEDVNQYKDGVNMAEIFKNGWAEFLDEELEKDYYKKLRAFLINEYRTRTIYPNMYDIFNALHFTDYKDVKAVIIGQDPYHGPNQAHGLSFSVKPGVRIPPSLVNMYKELHDDLGCYIPNNGYLEKWAREGVLLLNASLTVRAGQANSHRDIGWRIFTDKIISLLNDRTDPVVFILWGNYAISKESLITNDWHYIIKSVHPSPLSASRGFFGSKPFSKTNNFLKSIGKEPIDWQIENI
jgi:uracil-DNA glycosylase